MQPEKRRRYFWFAVFTLWIILLGFLAWETNIKRGSAGNSDTIPSATTDVSIQKLPMDNSAVNNQEILNTQSDKDKDTNVRKDLLVDYRMHRDKARSEQVNNYREMINNPNTDPSIKKTAQESLLGLTHRIEQEMEIESLIRAIGFPDALAFIHENAIDLIVQCDNNGLEKNDVIKIRDIIVRITDFNDEDMNIIEKKTTN